MTENEAKGWIETQFGTKAVDRLARLIRLILIEGERQNLIAPSTQGSMWNRHIADSAQLVGLGSDGRWLDVGTGAGFPGMVVALLRPGPIVLVEPRRLRATFLEETATALALSYVSVRCARAEKLAEPFAIISARAVAPVEKLLRSAAACATSATRWLLPRGSLGPAELAELQQRWRGVFHMKQSITDPTSAILIADQVSPR